MTKAKMVGVLAAGWVLWWVLIQLMAAAFLSLVMSNLPSPAFYWWFVPAVIVAGIFHFGGIWFLIGLRQGFFPGTTKSNNRRAWWTFAIVILVATLLRQPSFESVGTWMLVVGLAVLALFLVAVTIKGLARVVR